MASASEGALLAVSDLHVDYAQAGRHAAAVDGVSFTVARGETLALVGESGCGKSTVAKAAVGLLRPTGGRVEFAGHDLSTLSARRLRALRPRFQMVFQDPGSSLDPRATAGESIAEPLTVQRRGTPAARARRVAELLERVGLPAVAGRRYPFELSGGQCQRVALARALALDPDLIVADEPTSALDVSIQAQILALLRDAQRERGIAYLFISHDLGAVRQLATRIAVLYLGRICETGPTAGVLDRPAHPYTRALVSAAPVPDPVVEARRERIVLPGELPSRERLPSGCRFQTRCWLHRELGGPRICTTAEPPPIARADGGFSRCHFAARAHDDRGAEPSGTDLISIRTRQGGQRRELR